MNGWIEQSQRETFDQLGTTGTYVTRDGDGVLRHWNGITDEYVGSEPDAVRHRRRCTPSIGRSENLCGRLTHARTVGWVSKSG